MMEVTWTPKKRQIKPTIELARAFAHADPLLYTLTSGEEDATYGKTGIVVDSDQQQPNQQATGQLTRTSEDPLSLPLPLNTIIAPSGLHDIVSESLERDFSLCELHDEQKVKSNRSLQSLQYDSSWLSFLYRCKEKIFSNQVRVQSDLLVSSNLVSNDVDTSKNLFFKPVALSRARLRLDHLHTRSRMMHRVEDGIVHLTQKECIDSIRRLRTLLRKAWKQNEFTQALHIVIHAVKLLIDTSSPLQYPFLWAHVMEVLSDFILSLVKSLQMNSEKDSSATYNEWVARVASIRELLPRLYIQLALCQCSSFVSMRTMSEAKNDMTLLNHICTAIRGLGNPLVNLYCRAWFAHTGRSVLYSYFNKHGANRELKIRWCRISLSSLHDYAMCINDKRNRCAIEVRTAQNQGWSTQRKVNMSAVEWIVQALGDCVYEECFEDALTHCMNLDEGFKALLSGFPSHLVAKNASRLLNLLNKELWDEETQMVALYRITEALIAEFPRSKKNSYVQYVSALWSSIKTLSCKTDFVHCTAALIHLLTLTQASSELLNTIQQVLLEQLTSMRGNPEVLGYLELDLQRICQVAATSRFNTPNFGSWTKDGTSAFNFALQVCEYISNNPRKRTLGKLLLKNCSGFLGVTTPQLNLALARDLHDTIDAKTPEEECCEIGALICQFIAAADLEGNLEQKFQFLGDCRASFPSLETVQQHIIVSSASLAMQKLESMPGCTHNKQSKNFARSCLAFCHISTPSIQGVKRRFTLSCYCAQVAFSNGLLPQMDRHLKEALNAFDNISVEADRLEYVKYFLGCVTTVLGPPVNSLHYLREVYSRLQNVDKWDPSLGLRAYGRLALLQCLGSTPWARLVEGCPMPRLDAPLFSFYQASETSITEFAMEIVKSLWDEDVAILKTNSRQTDEDSDEGEFRFYAQQTCSAVCLHFAEILLTYYCYESTQQEAADRFIYNLVETAESLALKNHSPSSLQRCQQILKKLAIPSRHKS